MASTTPVFKAKSLAGGYVPTVMTVLYQTPSGNTAYIKTINITNTSGSATMSVQLAKNIGGMIYQWYTFNLLPGDMADILEGEALNLSANDSILCIATTPSTVNYTIHGVEETNQ